MKNANVLLVMVFFLNCNIGATKAGTQITDSLLQISLKNFRVE